MAPTSGMPPWCCCATCSIPSGRGASGGGPRPLSRLGAARRVLELGSGLGHLGHGVARPWGWSQVRRSIKGLKQAVRQLEEWEAMADMTRRRLPEEGLKWSEMGST